MAGHSHSANIRFRKDRVDSKRATAFAKLSRMITVAARQGCGAPDGNPRLRLALDKARVLSMSKEAIERAIKKGIGANELGDYEEVVYEAYGPGGVALMLDILTDNRHRTAADVRMVFDKHGGNLAANGAVGWMFERRARFLVDRKRLEVSAWSEDRWLELGLEIGADDVRLEDGEVVLLGPATALPDLKAALDQRQVPLRAADLVQLPKQRVVVADPDVAWRVVRVLDALEDHDDVQAVFSNEDFTAEVMQSLEER